MLLCLALWTRAGHVLAEAKVDLRSWEAARFRDFGACLLGKQHDAVLDPEVRLGDVYHGSLHLGEVAPGGFAYGDAAYLERPSQPDELLVVPKLQSLPVVSD